MAGIWHEKTAMGAFNQEKCLENFTELSPTDEISNGDTLKGTWT